MLEIAREKVHGTRFLEGTFEDLPIDDGSVDLAVASLALCHLADPLPGGAGTRSCAQTRRHGGDLRPPPRWGAYRRAGLLRRPAAGNQCRSSGTTTTKPLRGCARLVRRLSTLSTALRSRWTTNWSRQTRRRCSFLPRREPPFTAFRTYLFGSSETLTMPTGAYQFHYVDVAEKSNARRCGGLRALGHAAHATNRATVCASVGRGPGASCR